MDRVAAAGARDVTQEIAALLDSLPEGEKAVAAFISRNMAEVPHLSIYRLAEEVGVSTATVSRLARRLGYANLRELKIDLARLTAERSTRLFDEVSPEDSEGDVVRKVFAANSRSLEDTLRRLDLDRFALLAESFRRARHVLFVGTGSSGHVAQDAALRFCHLAIAAEACADPILALARSALVEPSDLVVGISHSGRSVVPVKCLEMARDRGAQTVAITNYPLSPLARRGEHVLCTAFSETTVRAASLSSRAAQITLIDALYLLTAHRMDDRDAPARVNRAVEETVRIPPSDEGSPRSRKKAKEKRRSKGAEDRRNGGRRT